jgi:hypothetical protein
MTNSLSRGSFACLARARLTFFTTERLCYCKDPELYSTDCGSYLCLLRARHRKTRTGKEVGNVRNRELCPFSGFILSVTLGLFSQQQSATNHTNRLSDPDHRIINFQDLRSSTGNDCRSPECRRDRPQGLTPCKGGLSGCGIGRSFLPCNAAQRLRFWDFESSQEAFFGRTAHFHTHTLPTTCRIQLCLLGSRAKPNKLYIYSRATPHINPDTWT